MKENLKRRLSCAQTIGMRTQKKLSLFTLGMVISMISFAQSLEEIINKHIEAIGGRENWLNVQTMRQEASLNVQGTEIPVVITIVHGKAYKQEFSVMGMSGYSIITPTGGWNLNPLAGQTKAEPISADELKLGKDQLDITGDFINFTEKEHTVELLEKETVNGVTCHTIKLTRKSGISVTYFLDPSSYMVVRSSTRAYANGQEVTAVVNMSNYQKLPEGIVVPFTVENNLIPAPINFTKFVVNGQVDDKVFRVE